MNRRNSEWYPDPTAYLALSAIAREEKKSRQKTKGKKNRRNKK